MYVCMYVQTRQQEDFVPFELDNVLIRKLTTGSGSMDVCGLPFQYIGGGGGRGKKGKGKNGR